MPIHVVNQAEIKHAINDSTDFRTKHMDIKCHIVRDHLENGSISFFILCNVRYGCRYTHQTALKIPVREVPTSNRTFRILYGKSCQNGIVRMVRALLSTAKILRHIYLIISSHGVPKSINNTYALNKQIIAGPVSLCKVLIQVCHPVVHIPWLYLTA